MSINMELRIMEINELEKKIKAILEFMENEETEKLMKDAHKKADDFTKELALKRYFDHKKYTEEVRL